MAAHLMAMLLAVSGPVIYAVVAALAFGESAAFVGLVLPGETALLFAGVIAGRGAVGLPQMVAVAAVAAIVGDLVAYRLGRAVGPASRRGRAGRWIGESRWARAEQLLERRGGPAVFWCRWIGVLRALVPTLAGVGQMPYRTFIPWNVAGGLSWASSVIGLGYLFSGSVDTVVRIAAGAGTAMTAAVAVLVVLALSRRIVSRGRCSPIAGIFTGWRHGMSVTAAQIHERARFLRSAGGRLAITRATVTVVLVIGVAELSGLALHT